MRIHHGQLAPGGSKITTPEGIAPVATDGGVAHGGTGRVAQGLVVA